MQTVLCQGHDQGMLGYAPDITPIAVGEVLTEEVGRIILNMFLSYFSSPQLNEELCLPEHLISLEIVGCCQVGGGDRTTCILFRNLL